MVPCSKYFSARIFLLGIGLRYLESILNPENMLYITRYFFLHLKVNCTTVRYTVSELLRYTVSELLWYTVSELLRYTVLGIFYT
jgi:hypothetical protein